MQRHFSYTFTIAFADTDSGGVVYHTRYLEIAERARSQMLQELGTSNTALLAEDTLFAVQHMDVTYHQPARLDDVMTVDTHIKNYSGARLQLLQVILSPAKTTLVTAQITLACLNQQGRPKRLPHSLIKTFNNNI